MANRKGILQQFKSVWQQTSVSARVGTIITLIVSVVVIIGVGYWSAQPHYVMLASELSPQQSAEIVSRLEAAGIANQLNYSGSGVLVDQKHWNKAQLQISDVVEPDQIEAPTNSMFTDPQMQTAQLSQQKEQRLAKTITRLKSVEAAWVHLAIPPRQAFARDKKEPSASVVIKLKSGIPFSRNQGQSIVSLVANSVEGLDPEDINVVDTDGNLLAGDDQGFGTVSNQLQIRREHERYLADKAEMVLEKMLGIGKAEVQVSVEMDFTQTTTTNETIDPKSKAIKSERITTKTGTEAQPFGTVGTSSNIGTGNRGQVTSNIVLKDETSDIEYELGTVTETRMVVPGRVTRLSVAAVVEIDGTDSSGGTDPAATSPAGGNSGLTKEQIQNVLMKAVGFDPMRNDEIEVIVAKMAENIALQELEEEMPVDSSMMLAVVKNSSLGIAALVALLLGFMVIRKLRPVEVPGDAPAQTWSPQRAKQIANISALVNQHPDLLSQIMTAWQGEQTSKEDTDSQTAAKRAA